MIPAMIPAGVVRIVCAIAPTAEFRDAMLGDFVEEYEARLQHGGRANARAYCWRQALLSLAGVLYRSRPRPWELFTTILPAAVWGSVAAACASAAAMMLLLPAVYRFVPVSHSAAWIVASEPVWLSTAVLGGYEAARIGRRSPLWSALTLGLMMSVLSMRAIPIVWFWPIPLFIAPTGCVAGAVLQQAQSHRLAWGIAKQA